MCNFVLHYTLCFTRIVLLNVFSSLSVCLSKIFRKANLHNSYKNKIHCKNKTCNDDDKNKYTKRIKLQSCMPLTMN